MAVIDRAAAHQGWPLRGVPLYTMSFACINTRIDSKCAIRCVQVSNLVMIQYHTILFVWQ